jgi:hypothetical protein
MIEAAAMIRCTRVLQHLAPPTLSRHAAAASVGIDDDDLSGFYVAHGQQTPGPPHEPELHGAPMAASVGATPHVSGFGPDPILSPEEIASFKANGFLVKQRLVEPSKVAAALDTVWDVFEGHKIADVPDQLQLPPSGVSRGDKASWMDAHTRWPAPDLLGQEIARNQPHGSTTWRRASALAGTAFEAPDGNAQRAPSSRSASSPSWQICALGSAKWMLDLLPQDEAVRRVAVRLLGRVRPSHRVRGIYAVFPTTAPPSPLGPHMDRVCQQLNAATYLDDVSAGGGAFTVWPGSHLIMSKGHRDQSNWSPTMQFRPLLRHVRRTIQPVELCGKQG